jgi:hypothetical protein
MPDENGIISGIKEAIFSRVLIFLPGHIKLEFDYFRIEIAFSKIIICSSVLEFCHDYVAAVFRCDNTYSHFH